MNSVDYSYPVRPVGANLYGDGRCLFCVWAPEAGSMELVDCANDRAIPMEAGNDGYWRLVVASAGIAFGGSEPDSTGAELRGGATVAGKSFTAYDCYGVAAAERRPS